ncbi:hypothetical protein [Empedobacter brevis]|uniref:hypothetical protein n=1 Tax=Empedobacter brevis TaxID=247 RepID=UPI0028D86FF9|nr:hypothetical protein [Empedobacter brevis]
MKHYVTLLLTTLSLLSYAQDKNVRMSVEYGYFNSSFQPASEGGSYLSGSFGYKINKDFWLNIDLLKITAKGTFEASPLFLNNKTTYTNTIIAPNFSKDWKLSDKFVLTPSLGGALIFERAMVPEIQTNGNQLNGISFSNQAEAFNVGLYGNIALKYQLVDNLFIGANIKSYLPMNFEPDAFLAGVSLEMRF